MSPSKIFQAANRLKAWCRSTPDLVFVLNRDGFYSEIAPGVSTLPILGSTEFVGKHYTQMNNTIWHSKIWNHALRSMDSGDIGYWVFEEYQHWYEARFICLNSEECLVQIRDVSEWYGNQQRLTKDVEKRTASLLKSNNDLRQFAYVASHDLREPLGKIKAFGLRLEERYAKNLDGKGLEYLAVMRSAADRMLQLIDALLAYSRVGQGVEHQNVDLNRVVSDTLGLMMLDDAKVEVSPNLPVVCGDPITLGTLFQNLIGNAIKFKKSDQPAYVRIHSESHETHDVIVVQDDGIGFDPQYTEKIFQIFERLHTRFRIPGTGIGLAMCRRIMDQHDGYIQAEGQPNEGATFRLVFPRKFPC